MNAFEKREILLNKDILRYLFSEFIYTKEFVYFLQAHRCFHVEPYQYNFSNNKINLKDLKKRETKLKFVPLYYFDHFNVATEKSFVFEKMKIKHLKTTPKCNKKLEECIFDIENSKIETIEFGKKFNKPLPQNLPSTLESIIFNQESNYNQQLPENLPSSLKFIKFGYFYNEILPDNLPRSMISISFGHDYNQVLPENLPKTI